jgi:hypothetical protein
MLSPHPAPTTNPIHHKVDTLKPDTFDMLFLQHRNAAGRAVCSEPRRHRNPRPDVRGYTG